MNFADLVGQTLDDKYQIESQLGRGGMGTVYLATHLGTERPVAVKIIAPQFMKRPEFVERFRREARAAGRLRHPNVVDVTDFGFADTEDGRVAYLVMEYLDGCTLGEILEEEKNLPVPWTLDILDQVCSAVQEAHEQGIIHRDLKPDNIWLEPNQRGGYTVKVLDFGIAKLEAPGDADHRQMSPHFAQGGTMVSSARGTLADAGPDTTIHDSISPTLFSESATVALAPERSNSGSEIRTLVQPLTGERPGGDSLEHSTDQDTVGTKLIDGDEGTSAAASPSIGSGGTTSELTRVGAVLGTPLYMSPEQCRGERLDARSDVYSLGVIAYQMLSGSTPFTGEFEDVMTAHRELPPPPLNAKKARKKLKREIVTALSKDPDDRPQSAEALASVLRSRSEGIWALLRRAGMIYTEHMPKFLTLSGFFFLPTIVLTVLLVALHFLRANGTIASPYAEGLIGLTTLVMTVVSGFCTYLIIGTTTWVVTQSMAVPLRPIRVRTALKEARNKWRTFAGTGLLTTVLMLVLLVLTLGIGFLIFNVLWMLVAPVVMMENLRGRQALKRSKDLVRRSLATAAAAACIMFLIPAVSAGLISYVVKLSAKVFLDQRIESGFGDQNARGDSSAGVVPAAEAPRKGSAENDEGITITFGDNRPIVTGNSNKDMQTRLRDAIFSSMLQIFLLPMQIVVISFTAIIVALLYLKTRQAGGEPLIDLLSKFEDTEHPTKRWQERVRERLIQSGRITSRT